MNAIRERLLLSVGPGLGYAYIRLLRLTMRLEYRNSDVLDRVRKDSGQYVLAFWHSRFVMMRFGYPGQRLVVLSSEHRDSRMLARVLARLGLVTAWGSSTAGGAAGMRQLLRRVREGYDVGLTPDGPRGPRRQVKPGVVAAARLTGLPIVPVAFSARPARRLRSWDRTLIPYPFSRGIYLYGEPFRVPRPADELEQAEMGARLSAELDRLTDLADREIGLGLEEPRPEAT